MMILTEDEQRHIKITDNRLSHEIIKKYMDNYEALQEILEIIPPMTFASYTARRRAMYLLGELET
jgi:hypothetical protein